MPSYVAGQSLIDFVRLAVKTNYSITNEHLGAKRPDELDVGIGSQNHVRVRRGNRGQLDHLLLNPASNGRKRLFYIDRQVSERHVHERRRQKFRIAADLRPRTREFAEQREIGLRHDNLMPNSVRRISQDRSIQRGAQIEIRRETFGN
jgi:hypothetical protein